MSGTQLSFIRNDWIVANWIIPLPRRSFSLSNKVSSVGDTIWYPTSLLFCQIMLRFLIWQNSRTCHVDRHVGLNSFKNSACRFSTYQERPMYQITYLVFLTFMCQTLLPFVLIPCHLYLHMLIDLLFSSIVLGLVLTLLSVFRHYTLHFVLVLLLAVLVVAFVIFPI